MPGRVDDVDLDRLAGLRIGDRDGGVFSQDRDAALAFELVRIHDPLGDHLVLAEHPRLLEHPVHQRRFAMVDVRDDGDIA